MSDPLFDASVVIVAPRSLVWEALTDPALVRLYMYGAHLATTWEPGSPIRWKGMIGNKAYENRGIVLSVVPHQLLAYTLWSNLSWLADVPENYVTVTNTLADEPVGTRLTVRITGGDVAYESKRHMEWGWMWVLHNLKEVLEFGRHSHDAAFSS